MNLTPAEILLKFDAWLIAWNEHNLEGVIQFMHEEVVFENWNGDTITGKNFLQKAWVSWFSNHGNFKFIKEDLFIDELQQIVGFSWKLEWPSFEKKYLGKKEIRRGMDVIHLKDGKILKKITYSKTLIQVESKVIHLSA